MKFHFCGDLDCPDWVLAEIVTLSKVTSVKMKLLCVQVVQDFLGKPMDYDKVAKLTADAKFETADIKASIAALAFIISRAAKHDTDADTLSNELQQLGMPKEHASVLCKEYVKQAEPLRAKLRESSLRTSSLDSVQWRVDYVMGSSHLPTVNKPCVYLNLKTRAHDPNTPSQHDTNNVNFAVDVDKFRVLLAEMKLLQKQMEALSSHSQK